jgi:hypothetical protein
MAETDHRVVCPHCNSRETERISLEEPGGPVDSGTTLVETRSCQGCYAGYRLTYSLQEVEIHHPPEDGGKLRDYSGGYN